MTEYLIHYTEAQLVKDCTGVTAVKFLFEHVVMLFGCLRILMSDHGMHFLNETINIVMEEFQVYHK